MERTSGARNNIGINYRSRTKMKFKPITKRTEKQNRFPALVSPNACRWIKFSRTWYEESIEAEHRYTVDKTVREKISLETCAKLNVFQRQYTQLTRWRLQLHCTQMSLLEIQNFQRGRSKSQEILRTRISFQNLGEYRVMNFDTVVTGPDPYTIDEVNILKVSTTDPTQSNPSVVNTYRGSFKHVICLILPQTLRLLGILQKIKYWAYVLQREQVENDGKLIWESGKLHIWFLRHLETTWRTATMMFGPYGTRCGYGICVVSPKGFILSDWSR